MEKRDGIRIGRRAGGMVAGCARIAGGRWGAVGGAVVLAVLVMTAAFPEALHACPVCFDRDDEARIAFLATTGC